MSYAYDNDAFSRYYDTLVADHLPHDVLWINTVKNVYTEIIQRTFVDNNNNHSPIVVELGCGTGENLFYFENYFQNKTIKLIGIDHSQAMLDRAKDKLVNNSIDFLHGSLTNFSYCLETKIIDCILVPAGTFHHLITDNERQEYITNIKRTLRPETGLCAIYLFSDSMICVESNEHSDEKNKLKFISTENNQQTDGEWISNQIFAFDGSPKIELSWQLRTCTLSKLIHLFISNNFEVSFCCLNGKDLLSYNDYVSSSSINNSTPVIVAFRTIKNTN